MESQLEPSRDCFADALEQQRAGLRAFLRRRLGAGPLVEDALQETLLRAWQKRSGFDTQRALGPWILTLASRVATDLQRRETLRGAAPLPNELATPADDEPRLRAERNETAERLQRALAALHPTAQAIFVAFHQRGLSLPEIQREFGIPAGTVKSHLHRARRRLAATLNPPR